MTLNRHRTAALDWEAGHITAQRSTPRRVSDLAGVPLHDRNREVAKVLLKDVSVTYTINSHGHLTALEDINLQVRSGEFLCIVGPSGCGKSTLLHLIAGLHSATSGKVLVDEKTVEGP